MEGCCGQDYVVVIYLLICLWPLTLDIYYAYDLWLYEFDLHPGQLYLIKVCQVPATGLAVTCDMTLGLSVICDRSQWVFQGTYKIFIT